MGLFDAFTGDPVKDAAAQNSQLYNQNFQRGLGYLDTGYNTANGALTQGVNGYGNLADLGARMSGGVGLGLDALGVNGADGNARALGAFQTGPGYQFQLGQGLQAVDRGAASRGLLSSGNTLMGEQKYGSDLANQEFGGWRNSLLGLATPATTAMNDAANGQMYGYNALSNLGQSDAMNRVNLSNTTTSGQAGANMQAANAQMGGNSNLWNFGLNLGRLASGWGTGGSGGFDPSRGS